MTPGDALEKMLAATVDASEVDGSEPQAADDIEKCDFCGCTLSARGLFVDGRLGGQLMWGNMCAQCFVENGEGIGWGKGQLYARQPDGK